MRKSNDALLTEKIVQCRLCPRLVAWREDVARVKVKRFIEHEYWGKPIPSFGPASARFVIVGLAPAAHGANRTGRMFTGDKSGEWLYEQLFRYGFSSAAFSESRDDGMQLYDTRITAVAHCAPPANKLLPEEIAACRTHFEEEMSILSCKRLILALGNVAYHAVSRYFGAEVSSSVPAFSHGASYRTESGLLIVTSFHPSQQNTYTGKLTKSMFADIFIKIRRELQTIDQQH
jgi:uracil-DNA glycosylase